MERTLILQLNPTPEQATILKQTLEQHTACFNEVAHVGFTTGCSNGIELHKETYYPLRACYPDLPSSLIAPIRYDQRSYWVKWNLSLCSLATIAARVELDFVVPEHLKKYVGNKTSSADLCSRKGRFTLHVVVSIPEPNITSCKTFIGIDLGLARPAVTSERQFLGDKRWQEQERRLFRIKRKLQKCGSKSAKRHLKTLSGQLFRQRKDHDHVLSKRIVQNTPQGGTLVLENLKNIRFTSKIGRGKGNKTVETKRRFHSWSFAQFHGFLSYKAAMQGIQVVKVDLRHTSQTCSKCRHQHRSNRRSQSFFKCRECGYSLNADLNASYNIREKYLSSLASVGTPSLVGSPVKLPIVSTVHSEGQAPSL